METTKEINKILEQERKKRERLLTSKLETRQHALKTWLEANFVSGKYFTIEAVIKGVKDSEGNCYYQLNTNPSTHDKCIALSNDVKQLNWHAGRERYIPIIKDNKGSIKLCENKEELETFTQELKRKVENAHKYANHLQSIIDLQGTMPFINQATRVLEEDEIKPIEVFAK